MKDRFQLVVICVVAFCFAAETNAQPPILNAANGEILESDAQHILPTASKPATPPQPESSTVKREEITEKLRVAQLTLDSATETSEQTHQKPPERLQREVELLKQLDVVIAQQQSAKAEHADRETRLVDFEAQLAALRENGPQEEKPYSFLVFDHLKDELMSKQSRTESVAAGLAGATEDVVRAKQTLAAKQQAFRQAKELEQANSVNEKKPALANATKFTELEVRIATEALAVEKQEQANAELAQKLHQTQLSLLEEKVQWIAKAVRFSDRDLQLQKIEIAKQEEDLKRDISFAESNLQYAQTEWTSARHDLDMTNVKSPELIEQVEAKQAAQQVYQTQVKLLNDRLERRGGNREVWERRFDVIGERATTDELIKWSEESHARLEQLEREKSLEQMHSDEARQDLVGLDKEYQSATDDGVKRWIDQQRITLNQLIQIHDANIVSIETSRRLTEKLIHEIDGDVEHWTIAEWIESAKIHARKVWDTELTKVDDHPLTVGKILMGLLLIFCGFVLSRMLSRTLGSRLQHERIGMNESGAAALQSLSFYVLLVCFTLTSLRFVNVPLTVFTFLGGAIAIGVGFGSQNILNNFISGLILLAERPIKVGDLIQIDDLFGNVNQIGARSTIIRTGSNLDIIVPNSTFLENNVVNLTRGDDKLRTVVKVGIAYGSPTREATKLMKNAAIEHGRVLTRPEPFVWFTEFGDNSLNFEVHFWVKVRTLSDQLRIESDLRYRIDQLFREAGISIAFPQRDVHIDASTPIPIRMLPPDEVDHLAGTSESDAA